MPDEPTPPEEPVSLKDQMLAEVQTDLPDGILNFLTTPLPAGPTLTAPNDVDSAIICQAEFCVWLGGLMGNFQGLTPVSIPMFMAQLNTVQQGMLLSALEYNGESQAVKEFEIVEPAAETVYYPGEMRISVSGGKDTDISGITGTILEAGARALGDEFDLIEKDGIWQQFVDLMDNGDYALTITATFPKGEPIAQTVNFRIGDAEEDEPEPPEGADQEALDKAQSKMQEALKALADQSVLDVPGYAKNLLNVVKTQYGVMANIAGKVLQGDAKGAIDTLLTEANGIVENFEQEIENYDPEGDAFNLGNIVGKLWNASSKVDGLISSFFS